MGNETFNVNITGSSGDTLSGTLTLTPASAPTPTPTPTPTPSPSGTHTVMVTVTDQDGVVWTANATVGNDVTQPAVFVTLTNASGTAHQGLQAWFYAEGVDVGCSRFDNPYDWINHSLIVTYDDNAVFNQSGVNFYRGARQMTIPYGTPAPWSAANLDKTLMPNYAPGQQASYDDSKYTYGYNALGLATYKGMGAQGDRGDIGFYPVWVTAFITNPTDATYAVMRRADNNSGIWSCYWSDPVTGGIIDITKYPNATTLSKASGTWAGNPIVPYEGTNDGVTVTPPASNWQVTTNPFTWDEAHETAYNFCSAMVTKSARDMDHASFWANNMLICFNPQWRQTDGVFQHYQERGTAWALRSLFLGAYVSSNQAYFANQLTIMQGLATKMVGANPFGIQNTYQRPGLNGPDSAIAVWEENYNRFVVDVLAAKDSGWQPWAAYLAKFIPLILTDGNNNPLPQYPLATIYVWTCKEISGNWLPDIMTMYLDSLQSNGWTLAEAQAITAPGLTVDEVYNQIKAKEPTWPGLYANGFSDLLQYDESAGAYPALMRAAAICAANQAIPGAAECLTIVDNVPTQPDFTKDWRFNIAPR